MPKTDEENGFNYHSLENQISSSVSLYDGTRGTFRLEHCWHLLTPRRHKQVFALRRPIHGHSHR